MPCLYSLPDISSQKKFIEFYANEIETTSKDARIFHGFDRGDYFSIHGRDIDIALKTSLKSSIIVKMMEPENNGIKLRYASMNRNLMERLIKELLLVQFYRVEIYTNKKDNKDEYVKMYKGSPGNLVQFENLLSNSSDEIYSNLLVSLQLVTENQQKVSLNLLPKKKCRDYLLLRY